MTESAFHIAPSSPWRRYQIMVISLAAGLALTLGLYLGAREFDQRRLQLEYDNFGRDIEALLKSKIAANLESLQSIASLYGSSREVDREEFALFTEPVLAKHPGVKALAWAPRVSADGVAAHESTATANLKVAAEYRVRAPATSRVVATGPGAATLATPDHYPVLYIEPFAAMQDLLGLDLARVPELAEFVARAIEHAEPVASAPIRFEGRADLQFDCLVFLPVYRKGSPTETADQRRENLEGLTISLVSLPDFMARALKDINVRGQEIQLIDPNRSAAEQLRYRSRAPGEQASAGRTDLGLEPWERRLPLAGRELRLVGLPTPQYVGAERRRGPLGLLIGGLLFTGLISAYLHTVSNRAQRIQAVVQERTRELSDANERLAAESEQRRRTFEALRQSEERHRAVVEQAADGITLVDAETLTIVEANQAFARLVGYSREELIGRPISELIADTAEGVAARARQTLGIGAPTSVQRQYRRKDGTIVDVEKSATVIQHGGRKVLCTVIHDITERKRAQEALDAERNLLRTVIDNLPDRIYVKDTQGHYVLDNPAHQRKLGVSDPAQVIGKTSADFFDPDAAARIAADDAEIIRTGAPLLEREEVSEDKGGASRWLLTTKVPLDDGNGRIIGIVGLSRDITERRRAQKLLEDKNRQLEQAIDAEHRAMAQLKEAQSALVQSEKLAGLGQMVAGVAHEINNPLSFVANNVAVLQRDLKPLRDLIERYRAHDALLAERAPEALNEIRELIQRIDLDYTLGNLDQLMQRSREGLRRIQQIVKDLRDFARLDEGDLHDADINEGIQSTVNIILGRAKKKQVRIELKLGSLPPVQCHPAKINQVVMNLLSNAIDASSEGATVTVSTRLEGQAVAIQVADHGSGISPSIMAKIFDPFFTTKKQGEGTGLGLSISYGIVQEHGGRIDVESDLGRGSTFTVHLPLRPAARKA